MTKRLLEDDVEERFQAVRPVYNQSNYNSGGSLTTTTTSTTSRSESDIVHIDIHLDTNGKEIVLWADILVAFKGADNARHNIRVLPFLKDENLVELEPLRIAAVPNATLDIYIEGNITQDGRDAARMRAATSQIQTPPPRKRGPQFDPEAAFLRKLEFEFEGFHVSTTADESIGIDGKDQSDSTSSITDDDTDTIPTPYDTIMQLSKKAKEGDVSAQVELGLKCLLGYEDDLPQDSEMAMYWFLQAANRGHAIAQMQVGLFYFDGGGGVQKDLNTAASWFLKAANRQQVDAQILLGVMYLRGWGVQQDHYRALQWLLPAANRGNAKAQHEIGSIFEAGTPLFSQDYPKAMEWYLKAADQAYADSQVSIGELHFAGHGIPVRDETTALEWFLKAAEQGSKNGQFKAGVCYEEVPGLRDYPKAMEWYLKAAQQGHQESQFRIGRMYGEGDKGVDKDYTVAMEWYLKAAKQGHVSAQVRLATIYLRGKGVKRDDLIEAEDLIKAAEWYREAVKQGSEDAQYALGMMYKNGQGVAHSFTDAKKLFKHLADHGHFKIRKMATDAYKETDHEEEVAETGFGYL
ncbi:hypothetical protein BGX24_005507 [Mortierella sp. AD032]|nr:hypothetical protein BGX24_005507 [Mortierella sp. AD032]